MTSTAQEPRNLLKKITWNRKPSPEMKRKLIWTYFPPQLWAYQKKKKRGFFLSRKVWSTVSQKSRVFPQSLEKYCFFNKDPPLRSPTFLASATHPGPMSRGNLRWCPWSLHRWSSTGPKVWGHLLGFRTEKSPTLQGPAGPKPLNLSIKNWMGPNPNGPWKISCDRATRYSGFFRGSVTRGSDRWRFLGGPAFSTHG